MTDHEALRTVFALGLANLDGDRARGARILDPLDNGDLREVISYLTTGWIGEMSQSGPYHRDCLRGELARYALRLAHQEHP